MRRLVPVLAGLLLLAGVVPSLLSSQPPQPKLQELTRRLDELWTSSASVARMELTVVTPRRTRNMRVKVWTRGEDRALIVIESPARERGTATLRRDRNLWNYLPRISRTIRVPPSMMLSSWMGSDLTNDDLTQSSSYRKDFDGEIVGPSDNPKGWLVRYTAHQGVVGLWKRIEFVINEQATLPLLARYYDRRMRLARVMRFEDVRAMDGRRVPTRLVLEPKDKQGHRTEIRYLDIDFDAKVPSNTFSLTQLERRR